MAIYLGPTEHIDHPENLLGTGQDLRTRLKSLMEPQKEHPHLSRDLEIHITRGDTVRRGTALPPGGRS